jgi:2-polyprenyl-6-hydroxyphenyl methylase/3-demethylubiquinone-9 3-methyltransferase
MSEQPATNQPAPDGPRQIPLTVGDGTIQLPSVTHQDEIRSGERFDFGKNWTRFLSVVNDSHIAAAEGHLRSMLRIDDLRGKSFLDIGSGSGLSSLAARRLGARVHSFDYDPRSVACTRELKRRFFPSDASWSIEEGSALDRTYLQSLGQFDVVYSWGVLHHTGAMWTALDYADIAVRKGGTLFIAIYNDQGGPSRRWRAVKRLYCSSALGRVMICAVAIPWFAGRRFVIDCLKGDNPVLFYKKYKERRGMSPVHDWFDWLGGYPFEVARPEQIFRFYRDKGLTLTNLTTKGALAGCNEFVFVREA